MFCLTFFREGCSPAARLDEPALVKWKRHKRNARQAKERLSYSEDKVRQGSIMLRIYVKLCPKIYPYAFEEIFTATSLNW